MLKKISNMFLLLGVLILFTAANAAAGIRSNTFTVTPQVGGMIFEGNQNLDPGITGGLALGYNFNAHWGAEGVLTLTSADQKVGSGSVDITAGHLDLLYHFLPRERLLPYLSLALGGIQLEDDNDLLAGYGVGLKYFLTEDIAIRLDIKHLFDINSRDVAKKHEFYNVLAATGGLSFQFGDAQKAELVKDRDADGIVDAVDRCPDTPSGVSVDETGCPQLLDSDQDGVTDNLDFCSDTVAGVVVDENGCPLLLDMDLDEVVDAQDACPDTPAKTVVDARGCPAQVALVVVLPEPVMTFYLGYLPNETEVRNDFAAEMEKMADFIKANSDKRFIIEGHTDSVGNDADNMKLSLLRAEKIRAYLSDKMGIPASLLEARGFGESNPIADNNTQEGRSQNRRVVIVALPQ